jgi:hypothetical protein
MWVWVGVQVGVHVCVHVYVCVCLRRTPAAIRGRGCGVAPGIEHVVATPNTVRVMQPRLCPQPVPQLRSPHSQHSRKTLGSVRVPVLQQLWCAVQPAGQAIARPGELWRSGSRVLGVGDCGGRDAEVRIQPAATDQPTSGGIDNQKCREC